MFSAACAILIPLGLQTLNSVGQTCTHIVFKNGHTNTVKRYR